MIFRVRDVISHEFGKLLEDLEMPHIRFHDLRHPYVKSTTKNIPAKAKILAPIFFDSRGFLYSLN